MNKIMKQKQKQIDNEDLQTLWHYAIAIKYGAMMNSQFATPSLLGRLELIKEVRRTLSRIGYDVVVNTVFADLWVQLHPEDPTTVADIEDIGDAVLEVVNAECLLRGIEGRTGDFPAEE